MAGDSSILAQATLPIYALHTPRTNSRRASVWLLPISTGTLIPLSTGATLNPRPQITSLGCFSKVHLDFFQSSLQFLADQGRCVNIRCVLYEEWFKIYANAANNYKVLPFWAFHALNTSQLWSTVDSRRRSQPPAGWGDSKNKVSSEQLSTLLQNYTRSL